MSNDGSMPSITVTKYSQIPYNGWISEVVGTAKFEYH